MTDYSMYYQFLLSPLVRYGIIDRPRQETSFLTGLPINPGPVEPLRFSVNTTLDNPPADFYSYVLPVMSDSLIAALQNAGVNNLQCFDALLENPDSGDRWTEYKAVNIIGLVGCADLRRSSYEKLGGGLYIFNELVINPRKASKNLFFRLKEAPSTIIAHKSLGDYLYGEVCPKMTGFRFWPTDADSLRKMKNSPLP